jgi:hypothetical protein
VILPVLRNHPVKLVALLIEAFRIRVAQLAGHGNHLAQLLLELPAVATGNSDVLRERVHLLVPRGDQVANLLGLLGPLHPDDAVQLRVLGFDIFEAILEVLALLANALQLGLLFGYRLLHQLLDFRLTFIRKLKLRAKIGVELLFLLGSQLLGCWGRAGRRRRGRRGFLWRNFQRGIQSVRIVAAVVRWLRRELQWIRHDNFGLVA